MCNLVQPLLNFSFGLYDPFLCNMTDRCFCLLVPTQFSCSPGPLYHCRQFGLGYTENFLFFSQMFRPKDCRAQISYLSVHCHQSKIEHLALMTFMIGRRPIHFDMSLDPQALMSDGPILVTCGGLLVVCQVIPTTS